MSKLAENKISLQGTVNESPEGYVVSFSNPLNKENITNFPQIKINGKEIPANKLLLQIGSQPLTPEDIHYDAPLEFCKGDEVSLKILDKKILAKNGSIEIQLKGESNGDVIFSINTIDYQKNGKGHKIPYGRDNYDFEIVGRRLDFVEDYCNTKLHHIRTYDFDPGQTKGNIENFSGVAQVPLGFAGPLTVKGENADGEFVIPLATTEGTLVSSYHRGMQILNLAGGAMTTFVEESMQRAPVFIFNNAREGKAFVKWLNENFHEIKAEAESTTAHGKLLNLEPYQSNSYVFVRFNFSTSDAAGQNMVGKATLAACNAIVQKVDTVQNFYLEANMATDKKNSGINILRTRGKRITAEAVIPRSIVRRSLRATPESLVDHYRVSSLGSFMANVSNNGCHSANGITAMFIATGQDVANVTESSAAIVNSSLTDDGDWYISLTIPSLIVASRGGGTSLPTQRECLEVLGCYGEGKSHKLAEVVTAVALAGEISLGGAIASGEWVSSHEKLGRNK